MDLAQLKYLIKEVVAEEVASKKQEFAPAPKMGDIESKKLPYKRPGMKRRPKSGMDVEQHKKMLWAESHDMSTHHLSKVWSTEEEPATMKLSARIRNMMNYGLTKEEVIEQLSYEGFSKEVIFLAWHAARILDDKEKKESLEEPLDEFNAMGTGAVVGFTGPLGMDLSGIHKAFWSGDEPEKKNSKKKV